MCGLSRGPVQLPAAAAYIAREQCGRPRRAARILHAYCRRYSAPFRSYTLSPVIRLRKLPAFSSGKTSVRT